jgi:hypothetical protein
MYVLCRTMEQLERSTFSLSSIVTDNREALIALGFERMYPKATFGYHSHLWSRSVDVTYQGAVMRTVPKLAVQRAFLDARAGSPSTV